MSGLLSDKVVCSSHCKGTYYVEVLEKTFALTVTKTSNCTWNNSGHNDYSQLELLLKYCIQGVKECTKKFWVQPR